MCPQHNVLFERLTVEEHLIFYGLLRGRTAEEVRAESVEMLKSLDLEKKRHSLAHTLSGGMKRKLSIATAFVGQAKVTARQGHTCLNGLFLFTAGLLYKKCDGLKISPIC